MIIRYNNKEFYSIEEIMTAIQNADWGNKEMASEIEDILNDMIPSKIEKIPCPETGLVDCATEHCSIHGYKSLED